MQCVELSLDERPELSWEFQILRTAWKKLKGLLGTDHLAQPVLLMRCSSIHTVSMRYPIDVAFVAKNGEVLLSRSWFMPGQFLSQRDAYCVLERPASLQEWPQEGEHLSLVSISVDEGAEGAEEERIDHEH